MPALGCDVRASEHAGQWWALAVISFIGLIVVCAGFPLGCAFAMRRRMNREREMVRKQEKSSVISQRDFGRDFSFIAGEYKPEAYYAECVDLLRKLMLTGWVLLIGEEAEQARVLVALLVSIGFLVLRLSLKPQRRCAAGTRGA